jgi:hypothetical protein
MLKVSNYDYPKVNNYESNDADRVCFGSVLSELTNVGNSKNFENHKPSYKESL